MFEKLEELEKKYEDISERINAEGAATDRNSWRDLMKEHAQLTPVIDKYREYKATIDAMDGNEEIINGDDEELREMAREETLELRGRLRAIEDELRVLLLPKDVNDDKNVIVEIRGGAGGEEAALFAHSVFRMYARFAERKRWKTDILSLSETELGGVKEIVFMIAGKGAYAKLKHESGVHRVQRVPETESSGRIHTSTITVAVLPEAEDVDVDINPDDVRIDIFRSSGAGGQHVNTTDSAVRLTHMPTGIVISCQDERSQTQNKDKAFKILRAKLLDLENEKQQNALSATRRSQVGRGNRNERIRTYNFPQGRVTEHRCNLTLYKIDAVMDGDFDEITDALTAFFQAQMLLDE